ncbi:MAG: DNA cytosine methyltransferase [Clostridia bacterium]|nr:DNA cytosine methyltransferase [Clostridia bacterium]
MKKKEKVAIDLFAGAGGLSCGLEKEGIEVRLAVEIWDTAADTYEKNLNNCVIKKDIRKVTGKEILNKIGIKKRQLFLLAGCPPCQGFSTHKRKKTSKDTERNVLGLEYARLINEIKPLFILMENVPGMQRDKKILSKIISKLNSYGYIVKKKILNAADFGVPQTRKRLVLHGVREDIYRKMEKYNIDLDFPRPTHSNPKKRDNENTNTWKTVRQVIQKYPQLNAGERHEIIPNHVCANLSEINIKRIKIIRQGGGSRDVLPEELRLKCHQKENVGYKDTYGIMKWDEPAPTLTGGCLSYSKGRYGHPQQNRAISAREAAAIQTFSDNFIFKGNLHEMAIQIGNAVPVDLAAASGRYFVELGEKLGVI